ncbi:MAG: gephyrin-like molybdotransferase Glp [Candidatus Pristimantibacillus sp.]
MTVKEMNVSLAVSVEEAVERLCAYITAPQVEKIKLETALQRILAKEFVTPFPMPPFRRAAMDGYAVRSELIASAAPDNPVSLTVTGEWKAGKEDEGEWINKGVNCVRDSAIRIFTGAPVPEPFDTVVIQETVKLTQADDDSWIQIDRPCDLGKHVAEAGEDIAANESLLDVGRSIGVREMAILASYGQDEVSVYKKPVVAILPVGDELLELGEPLQLNHIYDANGMTVYAFASEIGAEVIRYPPIGDRLDDISEMLEKALKEADVVITTGGISVGDYDFVARSAEYIGCEPVFTKVWMRPGTPSSAFVRDSRLIISLSGNPSACYSGLELLVKPVLLKLIGHEQYRSQWAEGYLDAAIDKPCPYPRYIRSVVRLSASGWRITPLSNDRSGNIAAFAKATALAIIPPGGKGATVGQIVHFIPLT